MITPGIEGNVCPRSGCLKHYCEESQKRQIAHSFPLARALYAILL